jgi:predicted transcriptional regulator of viral defense system
MEQESTVSEAVQKAEEIFQQHQGLLRTSEALRLGISPATLYRMRDAGHIVQENRGLYRLAEAEPLGNPDLVQIAKLIPKAVICLISALNFHGLTTQIPNRVYIALPRSSQRPRLAYPPLDVIWLPKRAYEAGVEEHFLDEVPVRIYSREKTIADCFRYEKRVGKDVALEALKNYLHQGNVNISALMEYARTDRVVGTLRPYLEALL